MVAADESQHVVTHRGGSSGSLCLNPAISMATLTSPPTPCIVARPGGMQRKEWRLLTLFSSFLALPRRRLRLLRWAVHIFGAALGLAFRHQAVEVECAVGAVEWLLGELGVQSLVSSAKSRCGAAQFVCLVDGGASCEGQPTVCTCGASDVAK